MNSFHPLTPENFAVPRDVAHALSMSPPRQFGVRSSMAAVLHKEKTSVCGQSASRAHSVPPVVTLDRENHFTSSPAPTTGDDCEMPVLSIKDMLHQLPEHAKWLVNALGGLYNAISLGPEYENLLRQFITFETLCNHRGSRRLVLPAANRPAALNHWVKCGRRSAPTISDLKQFVQEWEIYWTSLQPAWRERNDDGSFSTTASREDWTPLHCPGVTGIFGLVGGLNGWGTKAVASKASAGELENWKAAVMDLSWVMQRLIDLERTKGLAEEDFDELLQDGYSET
jgi:hypothetical protein